jgi:hypothetical protein
LVGPPSLKDTQAVAFDPTDPQSPPTYAPVRACGVKINKDVYLFDAATGKPMSTPDGNGILTLAQARANPTAISGLKPADEAKDWRPFLVPPQPALARRMNVERFRPGNSAVKLHIDILKQKAEFANDLGGVTCDVWNPKGDAFTPTRILAKIINEDPGSRVKAPIRDLYFIAIVPLNQRPKTTLEGAPLEYLLQSFVQPFATLRSAPNSPRDGDSRAFPKLYRHWNRPSKSTMPGCASNGTRICKRTSRNGRRFSGSFSPK